MGIALSCPKCGGNHLAFPDSDEEQVSREECGAAVQSLGSVKARLRSAAHVGVDARHLEQRKANRQARQEAEIQVSQAALRASVAETDRLIGESERMLRRHREENDRDV